MVLYNEQVYRQSDLISSHAFINNNNNTNNHNNNNSSNNNSSSINNIEILDQ